MGCSNSPTGQPTLGQSFQGPAAVRKLSEADHLLLAEYARDLLVTPHAAIHRDDAALDYGEMALLFSNGVREALRLNRHLPAA